MTQTTAVQDLGMEYTCSNKAYTTVNVKSDTTRTDYGRRVIHVKCSHISHRKAISTVNVWHANGTTTIPAETMALRLQLGYNSVKVSCHLKKEHQVCCFKSASLVCCSGVLIDTQRQNGGFQAKQVS